MFKSPDIPSDNLYKFLAVFGLVIFIFSIYLLIITQQVFLSRLDKTLELNGERIFVESKNISKKMFLNDKIALLQSKLKAKYNWTFRDLTDDSTRRLLKVDNQFESDLLQLKLAQLDLNLINDENSHLKSITDKNFEIHKNDGNSYIVPIMILMLVGGVLILFGFRLWYIRTQIHLDREIRKSINR